LATRLLKLRILVENLARRMLKIIGEHMYTSRGNDGPDQIILAMRWKDTAETQDTLKQVMTQRKIRLVR
jgi:hypothetical protein